MIWLHEQLSDYPGGLERIHRLEDELRVQWGDRLQPAQVRAEVERRSWEAGEAEKEQRYRYLLARWQKREAAVEQRHAARLKNWEQTMVRPTARAANWRFIVGLILLLAGCLSFSAPVLLYPLPGEQWRIFLGLAAGLVFASVIILIWGIYTRNRANRLRAEPPTRPPPLPRPRRKPDEPQPELSEPPNLNLQQDWLLALSDKAWGLADFAPDTRGKPGEDDLFLLLSENLPFNILALRNLLLKPRLDADLIVLGPGGIWLLDSKYWSGPASWNGINWIRGEREMPAEEKPPHLSWMFQEEALVEILQQELGRLPFEWDKIIHGGLAFTHPTSRPQIEPNLPVQASLPVEWVQRIQNSPPIPGFSLEVRLQVADTLAQNSRRLRLETMPGFPTNLAADTAVEVYNGRVAEIQSFVNPGKRPGS